MLLRTTVVALLVPVVLQAAPVKDKRARPAPPPAGDTAAPRLLAEARAASAAGDDAKASQVLAGYARDARAKDSLAPLVARSAQEYASRVDWEKAPVSDVAAARSLLGSYLFPPAEVQAAGLGDARVKAVLSRLRAADPQAAKLFAQRPLRVAATVAPGLPADLASVAENELVGALRELGPIPSHEVLPESLELRVSTEPQPENPPDLGGLSACTVAFDVRWTDAAGPVLPAALRPKQANVGLTGDEACRTAAKALAKGFPLAVVRTYLLATKTSISP